MNLLLRTRIILVSGIVIMLVVAIMSTAATLIKKQADDRYSESVLSSKQALWREIINSEYNAMESELFAFTRNREALQAIASDDRMVLSNILKPTYNRLSATKVIDAMLVADLHGQLLYPANYTADQSITRLVEIAINEGKLKTGLVKDSNGKLVSMFVVPLYLRPGHVVGAGVYMRELSTALANFSRNDKSDVYIVNNARRLDYGTNESRFNELEIDMASLSKAGFTVQLLDSQAYAVSNILLHDVEEQQLASLVSIVDYTENYQAQRNITVSVTLVVMGLIALAMLFVYWYMRRSLFPLQTVAAVMSRIASGDLTHKVESRSHDEIGQLTNAVAEMSDKLHEMVQDVQETTETLGTTAEQMKQYSQQTRSGVENQTRDTEQVATAMNEMTSTVQEVAKHASKAAQAAEQADVSARNGEEVVKNSVHAINELADKMKQVSGVIDQLKLESESITSVVVVIKEIAEQTNLLALNAAIEAARAGAQGKGFAVVADEVRNLANRTQASTTEIQEMIERLQSGANEAVDTMQSSQQQVGESVRLAQTAGESLQAITEGVASINEMNMQIAAAAEEQTSVSEEINRSIVNISHVAEQTSQGALETEKAGMEVMRVAQHLQGLVQQFRL